MIVKVCGMRETDNIRAVEEAGADWMGFICYERSPRHVECIPQYLPSLHRVGVFVNASYEYIHNRVQALHLDTVQLHGKESPSLCQRLQHDGLTVVKVFSLHSPHDLAQTQPYRSCCNYFLFDTPCVEHGGSGRMFDWTLLKDYQEEIPFLLSGGINPDSIAALSNFHHPQWAGIDLNSGFETAPARKDADKLRTFIQQFKSLKL